MANDKKEKIKKEKKRFSKDFKTELKKVTWPTGKQLVNNTIAVITIVIITAVIVFILDLGFETINKYGINKLKSTINNNKNDTVVVENNATPTPENTATPDATAGQEGNQDSVTPDPEAE